MIRFLKHYVTDGTVKARCHYSISSRIDGRKAVTIFAKDYDDALGKIFGAAYENQTDTMTDYFDKGCVRVFEDSPHYAAVKARAEQNSAAASARYEARLAKHAAKRAAARAALVQS